MRRAFSEARAKVGRYALTTQEVVEVKRRLKGAPSSSWDPAPKGPQFTRAKAGTGRHLTPEEIARAYPGTPIRHPVRFGPKVKR